MASETGIGWTDGTVNFVIGCTPVGPGCDDCYADLLALRKWGIVFEAGGERRETKVAFVDPLTWQRWHDMGRTHHRKDGRMIPVPRWVFACSLSDFFDNEWPPEVRRKAWLIIKMTPALRWQLVTKRIGNVHKMLPDDWNGGKGYEHVGIIATMVNQNEYDRDAEKLFNLYRLGVKWTGISIEPQIGNVELRLPTDWIITGGESKNQKPPRPYQLEWTQSLIRQCAIAGIPLFVKQLGDNPQFNGKQFRKCRDSGRVLEDWPASLRVQQMPRVYDGDPPYVPKLVKEKPAELF